MYVFFMDIWDSIVHFFGFFEWFLDGWLEKVEKGIQLSLKYATYFCFWISEQALITAYQITTEFLDSFNYADNVTSAWNSIPATPRAILGFLKVPECVNILVSAIGTKFVLKFVPFVS